MGSPPLTPVLAGDSPALLLDILLRLGQVKAIVNPAGWGGWSWR